MLTRLRSEVAARLPPLLCAGMASASSPWGPGNRKRAFVRNGGHDPFEAHAPGDGHALDNEPRAPVGCVMTVLRFKMH